MNDMPVRMRRWTSIEERTLQRLATERVPTRAIARALGRTPMAVRLMAHRRSIQLHGRPGRPRRLRHSAPPLIVKQLAQQALGAGRVDAYLAAESRFAPNPVQRGSEETNPTSPTQP